MWQVLAVQRVEGREQMNTPRAAEDFGLQSFGAAVEVEPSPHAPLVDIDGPAPLAREAFHGILGEIALENDPHTESDRAAVLLQLYVLVGNCIGRNPH
jgi:hypothetical protein